MRCEHKHTRTGEAHGFTGSVARPPYTEQNPAAHGGVTFTETCLMCGARRQLNRNGMHEERGTWGPSEAERERSAAQRKLIAEGSLRVARAAALKLGPVTFVRAGQEIEVWIDDEGFLCASGAPHTDEDLAAAARSHPAMLETARALRAAHIAVEAVRHSAQED